MWRHKNRPGVPDSEITYGEPPFGDQEAEREKPAKSWSKKKLVEWSTEQGYEVNEELTKDALYEEVLAQVEAKDAESKEESTEGSEDGSGELPDPNTPVTPIGDPDGDDDTKTEGDGDGED